MEGDALAIRPGNGVEATVGDVACRFDPRRITAEGLNCISHAHSDHLPRGFEGDSAIASRITLRCASERVGRKLKEDSSPHVKMLEAGHIRGSRMFLLDGGTKVLYTGDMCPEDRFGMRGARPVKSDVLIIESTYGSRGWDFPPREEIGAVIKDWVEDSIHQGFSVALMTYPLGSRSSCSTSSAGWSPISSTTSSAARSGSRRRAGRASTIGRSQRARLRSLRCTSARPGRGRERYCKGCRRAS